jgi:IS30 family transposase
MRKYTQLTQEQRYHIYALKKTGMMQSKIAEEVGVDKSTISRELRRNRGGRGYRPKQANELAITRRAGRSSQRISAETWSLVERLVRMDLSPEQVSGHLKKEHGIAHQPRMHLSAHTGVAYWRRILASHTGRQA